MHVSVYVCMHTRPPAPYPQTHLKLLVLHHAVALRVYHAVGGIHECISESDQVIHLSKSRMRFSAARLLNRAEVERRVCMPGRASLLVQLDRLLLVSRNTIARRVHDAYVGTSGLKIRNPGNVQL